MEALSLILSVLFAAVDMPWPIANNRISDLYDHIS
jgi:hypothetical protein